MVKFIGEDDFYPKWAVQEGRWVHQRVFTTVKGWMEQADSLARPPVSHETLVWVPKARNFVQRLVSKDTDDSRALAELQAIRLSCTRCDWVGYNPSIDVGYSYRRDSTPKDWRVRCPDCRSSAEPDLGLVDWDKAVDFLTQRWQLQNRPLLDSPGASSTAVSVRPITDFAEWSNRTEPLVAELIYVGQQLWSSFYLFWDALITGIPAVRTRSFHSDSKAFDLISIDYHDPKISRLEGSTGRSVWEVTGKEWNFSEPSIFKELAIFGSGDNHLTALQLSNGEVAWKYEFSETVACRPLITEAQVVVGCAYGSVLAVTYEGGVSIWETDLGGITELDVEVGRIERLIHSDGSVLAVMWESVHALDANDGHLLWERKLGFGEALDGYENLQVVGINLVGATTNSNYRITDLWSVDIRDGSDGWRFKPSGDTSCFTASGDLILYSWENDHLDVELCAIALDPSDAHSSPVEQGRVFIPKISEPSEMLIRNQVVFGLETSHVFSFDLDSQRLTWREELGGFSASTLHTANDRFLFVSSRNNLHAVDTGEGKVAWSSNSATHVISLEKEENSELALEEASGSLLAEIYDPFLGTTDWLDKAEDIQLTFNYWTEYADEDFDQDDEDLDSGEIAAVRIDDSHFKIAENSEFDVLGPSFQIGDIIRVREISSASFRYLGNVRGRASLDSPLLESLGLSTRVINCLKRAGFTRVDEIVGMPENELLSIDNFGQGALSELNEKLRNR